MTALLFALIHGNCQDEDKQDGFIWRAWTVHCFQAFVFELKKLIWRRDTTCTRDTIIKNIID